MSSQQKDVMIVDDDAVCLGMLQAILKRQGYTVVARTCPNEALKDIQTRPPSVLITDWKMPRISGGELCTTIRRLDLPRYIYTIVLTSSARDFVVQALDAGADDFITKPIDPNELTARLRAGSRILDLESRLVTLSERDSLTELYNRPTFMTHLEQMFRVAQDDERSLSCTMLDLDHFKAINDSFGHLAGDEVLAVVGKTVLTNIPKGAVAGRLGGEEFAIAMLDSTAEQAEMMTYDIRHALMQRSFKFGSQSEFSVTSSFGVAEYLTEFTQPSQLINAADQNLLMAKRIGRDQTVSGRYQFFHRSRSS